MTQAADRAFVRMEGVGHCYNPEGGPMAVQQIDLEIHLEEFEVKTSYNQYI